MRNYELFVIMKSKKDDSASQKAVRDLEVVLNKYGAKLNKNNGGNNAKLAYPIEKRQDSYQVSLEVSAEPENIAELRKQLTLVDDVMRFNFFVLEGAAN